MLQLLLVMLATHDSSGRLRRRIATLHLGDHLISRLYDVGEAVGHVIGDVHAVMTLRLCLLPERLAAHLAHERRKVRVQQHVLLQLLAYGETSVALGTLKRLLTSMHSYMPRQVRPVVEGAITHGTAVGPLTGVDEDVLL